ncbi:MAG: addiction module protein [Myxococcales bacterium]|nr:addiction module protein [Myxococcales bacterium]
MTDHALRLLHEALTPGEREALVEALSATLQDQPATLGPHWEAVVRDRIADLAEGGVETVPWQDVEARLRRTLARR